MTIITTIRVDHFVQQSKIVKNEFSFMLLYFVNLKINPKGGDLVFLEMNNYLDDDKKNKYVLLKQEGLVVHPSYNNTPIKVFLI